MMLLVDERDSLIKVTYDDSVDFSISGHYPLHVSSNLTGVSSNATNSPATIFGRKLQAYKDGRSFNVDESFQEEFLAAAPASIDTVNSSGFIMGKNKRTGLLPGGYIMTTDIAFAGPRAKVFCDWYGFTLYSKPTALPLVVPSISSTPDSLYMNYDPISGLFNFDTTTFTVELYQSGGPLIQALTPFQDITLGAPFGPGNVTLKIINNSTKFYHLSEIVLLAGT